MQKKKNIRLLITLGVLLLVTAAVAFVDLSSSDSVDADIFKIKKANDITRVVINGKMLAMNLCFQVDNGN